METKKNEHSKVLHLDDVEPRIVSKGKRFGFTGKRLGTSAGAKNLGCTWFEVPPGRKAFPHHYHCVNEEALFVLEGTGALRIGDETIEVGPGHYASFPPGPEHAHSLVNTGTTPLRYLCFSHLPAADIVGYPDSKKFAAFGGSDGTKGLLAAQWIAKIFRDEPSLDYYEGEKLD